jgi:signal transduction histidine kinase
MVNPVYQYILYGWGIFVLCRYGWRKSRMHRMQIVLLLAGTAFPVFGNILYVLGINPASGFDLTPFYISSATIIYGVTIICFRLMDVLPVAYKALVKNIPDGILVLDAQLKIVEINPAMESIIGQSKKSVEGRPLFDVWSELGGLTAQAQDLPHAELTVGPMVIGPMSIGPISKQICLDASIVCLLDRHQNISGKLVVLRDISELKAAHQKLETTYNEEHRLRGRLEDEINKRSQYSRAVVHELRTPLTSIMASSELLEEEIKEPVHLKLVQNIRRSSSNMEQRVNELFELARGELGMVKIDPRPFDMGRLVREATAELAPVAAEKGLVLRSNLPAISLPVIGDEGRLKQVLINLVSNSLKFTTKGEIVIQTGYFDYQFLKVQVKGMGPGMLENLFDPYHRRMKENGASTGLGIGLALSKIFVELHCGRVWAESEPGKGTTISFTVPYAEAPPSGQLLNASGEAASGEINFR